MKLIILGTGTSQVSKERASCSYYLEVGDKKALVDCGTGALPRMSQAGLDFRDIDIIFISHFHIDHISDLFALLWGFKYERKRKLDIIGPNGFIDFYKRYVRPIVFSPEFDQFDVEINEINEHIDFRTFDVYAKKTLHTKESIAYRFEENGKKLVTGGDMDYEENFSGFCADSDLLILECSFDNSKKVKGHLIPREAGKIARSANAKRLIITHFYPIEKEVRLEETKEIFENTIMAEDLMRIDV